MRSGSFTRPRPLVEFDCGSQSTSRVLTSAAAKEAARLMAVVVLPTPPFWLATAITRPINHIPNSQKQTRATETREARKQNAPRGAFGARRNLIKRSAWNIYRFVFHGEHKLSFW